jgi:hypothetical protein
MGRQARSRRIPEPPSTVNMHHQPQPMNVKLARVLNPRPTHENTLVMRRWNLAIADQARRLRRRGPCVSARALPWEARPGARRAPSAEWRRSTWLIRLRGPVWRTAVLLGPGATVQWRGCLRGVVSGVDAMLAQDEHPGLFLRQHHNPPRPVGKPLEHAPRRPFSPSYQAMPGANTVHRAGEHLRSCPTRQ